MSEVAESFIREYARALEQHLEIHGEEELAAAYDLGRWALSQGLGLLDVVEAHQNVTDRLASTRELSVQADQFLLQSLAAFEMAQRGFWDVQEQIKLEEALVTRLQAVTTGSIAIMGHVGSDERLVESVEQARIVVGASHTALALLGENPRFYSTARDPLDERLREIMRTVAATGKSVRTERSESGDCPVVCVPALVDPGAVQGALLAWGDREFDASDEAALEQLATMGAIAWNNSLVYERQHEISLALQESLLPEAIPDIAGLSIAARYAPAGPSIQVGGDWYDVIERPGGEVALVVGDVMGHDIKAASVMGQLSLALRAYVFDGYSAVEVMNRADRLLGRLDGTRYATAIYVVLQPGSGRMGIVNAGHPEPLLLEPSGQAHFVTVETSQPLGVGLLGCPHREESLAIQRGSTLLLYTDGLIESRNRSIEDGMAKLKEVAANFKGSPDELCDLALTTVTDATLQDDVCLLAVHLD